MARGWQTIGKLLASCWQRGKRVPSFLADAKTQKMLQRDANLSIATNAEYHKNNE